MVNGYELGSLFARELRRTGGTPLTRVLSSFIFLNRNHYDVRRDDLVAFGVFYSAAAAPSALRAVRQFPGSCLSIIRASFDTALVRTAYAPHHFGSMEDDEHFGSSKADREYSRYGPARGLMMLNRNI